MYTFIIAWGKTIVLLRKSCTTVCVIPVLTMSKLAVYKIYSCAKIIPYYCTLYLYRTHLLLRLSLVCMSLSRLSGICIISVPVAKITSKIVTGMYVIVLAVWYLYNKCICG